MDDQLHTEDRRIIDDQLTNSAQEIRITVADVMQSNPDHIQKRSQLLQSFLLIFQKTWKIPESILTSPISTDKATNVDPDIASNNLSANNFSLPLKNTNQPLQSHNVFDMNKNVIIAKSSGSRKISEKEIYRLISDQNVVTTAVVVGISSQKNEVEITCKSEKDAETRLAKVIIKRIK